MDAKDTDGPQAGIAPQLHTPLPCHKRSVMKQATRRSTRMLLRYGTPTEMAHLTQHRSNVGLARRRPRLLPDTLCRTAGGRVPRRRRLLRRRIPAAQIACTFMVGVSGLRVESEAGHMCTQQPIMDATT